MFVFGHWCGSLNVSSNPMIPKDQFFVSSIYWWCMGLNLMVIYFTDANSWYYGNIESGFPGRSEYIIEIVFSLMIFCMHFEINIVTCGLFDYFWIYHILLYFANSYNCLHISLFLWYYIYSTTYLMLSSNLSNFVKIWSSHSPNSKPFTTALPE